MLDIIYIKIGEIVMIVRVLLHIVIIQILVNVNVYQNVIVKDHIYGMIFLHVDVDVLILQYVLLVRYLIKKHVDVNVYQNVALDILYGTLLIVDVNIKVYQ